MVAASKRWWTHASLALLVCLSTLQPLPADETARQEGLFLAVPAPTSTDVGHRIKLSIERALQRQDRPIRKIVLDFTPDGAPSHAKEYGPCRDLADYLQGLRQIKTVAFLTADVSGHSVLPVLACQEIVMGPKARLGDVTRDEPNGLKSDQVRFYEDLARTRSSPAIVYKMFDRELEVLEGTLGEQGGVCYLDRKHEAEYAKRGMHIRQGRPPVIPAGVIGFYKAADALKLGLCDLVKPSRAAVAEAYNLEPTSLRGDPLEGRKPEAVSVVVREPISDEFVANFKRHVSQALGRGANVLLIKLESRAGDTIAARAAAEFLRTLKDNNKMAVLTIAYVPEKTSPATTFLALGCSEIVMQRNAQFGSFDDLFRTAPAGDDRFNLLRESLEGLADEQGYPTLVIRGLLDPSLTIYRVHAVKGGEVALVTEEQLKDDASGKWDKNTKQLVKAGGGVLVLDAAKARELGIARNVVESQQELLDIHGIKDIREIERDFLSNLSRFLRSPFVSVLLFVVGMTCLLVELKIPGVSLPGIIAAFCFVLFFWSHSRLAGQIIWLSILLFILGLLLLALEIFVIPGFGVTGISGILLIVLSLALATLEKKPETRQEWMSLGKTAGTFGISLLLSFGLAMLLAWYLPQIPYVNRLVLKANRKAADAFEEDAGITISAELAALLGAIGLAETTLRPAGIARFGERFVDVISEGSYVEPGRRIQVVEIEGNRVVVKEVG